MKRWICGDTDRDRGVCISPQQGKGKRTRFPPSFVTTVTEADTVENAVRGRFDLWST